MAELDPQNPGQEGNPDDLNPGGQNPGDELIPTIEELQAQIEELKTQSDKEKEGLVGQIKELRGKLHEAQFANKPNPEPNKPVGDEIEDRIRAVLSKDKEEKITGNRISALRKFYSKHPEFNPENDIAGLRGEALMSTHKRLNTQNSVSEEEILDDLESAYILMNKSLSKKDGESIINQFASNSVFGGKPKVGEEQKLTMEQEKLRKDKGWTVEKYLKMKSKYPKIIL